MAQSSNDSTPNSYEQFAQVRKDLREELVRWMESELRTTRAEAKSVKSVATEAKTIAIRARDRSMQPHECTQVAALADLKTSVGSWSKWWRGIMALLVVSIAGLGMTVGGWWYQHKALKTEVTTLKTEVSSVKTAIDTTNTSLGTFRGSFEKQKREDKAASQKQVKAIADAVGEAVKKEFKNSRRR